MPPVATRCCDAPEAGLAAERRGDHKAMTESSTPREHPQDPAEGAETPTPEQHQPVDRPQDPAEGPDDESATEQ